VKNPSLSVSYFRRDIRRVHRGGRRSGAAWRACCGISCPVASIISPIWASEDERRSADETGQVSRGLCHPESGSVAKNAARVSGLTNQSNIAISCLSVAPASAASVAPALRNPRALWDVGTVDARMTASYCPGVPRSRCATVWCAGVSAHRDAGVLASQRRPHHHHR
jgi:hypothetical protein